MLESFDRKPFTHDGVTRPVFRAGNGPGIVVMHEVPGIYSAVAEFAERLVAEGKVLVYENRNFAPYRMHGFDNGNVFYGTEGYMIFSRRGAFSIFLGPKNRPGPTEGRDLRGQTGYPEHMADFLNAVRRRSGTRANPEVAHRSCALVHLGEIAFRTRGRIDFDLSPKCAGRRDPLRPAFRRW